MSCCTKSTPSCRISAESCDCCTCSSAPIIANICEACGKHPHSRDPHRHEGCSCVHPIIICACASCKAGEDSCHGHHLMESAPKSLEEKQF